MNVATKDPDQELGDRFKALRSRLGLTQDDVAKGGLRRTEVTDVEKGRNKVTSDRVVSALARGFGVTADVVKALRDDLISVEEAATKTASDVTTRSAEPNSPQRIQVKAEGTADISQREREWIAVGLMARGVEEGPAYRIALTLDFSGADNANPAEILEYAVELAQREKVERKGKAVGERPIRVRQSPSGSMTRVELPSALPTQPPKPR